jgi:hypothetical protein
MEAPIEIRYAGVVVGRAQEVRQSEGDDTAFFIPVRDPMPVGTLVRLRSRDRETPARVMRTLEAADGAGMHVRLVGESEEVAIEWIPPPPEVVEKPKTGTPTPVVQVPEGMRAATKTDAALPHNVVPVIELRPDLTPEIMLVRGDQASAPPLSDATETPRVEARIAESAPVQPAPSAPEAAPAEAAPTDVAPVPSAEIAAIPEAVPVAVGSSMTGALENATESIPVSVPAASKPNRKTKTPPTSADTTESATVQSTQGEDDSAAASAATPTSEELPPARPINGPSGRRKTKRRK